ncbi:serine/threonine protein kinase, AGC [Puccinia graminis f. sp. tritici]|uniref:cAMP-dependent protein kinase n=1 Tax=Puccinia graminis f. sp. tritici TaxID=56615 RepID=A0A5B0SHJ8_PUCGR|nr:serine/threonine protein kinase, AGC [Puccinia graminis f. sp. tritici]
MTPTRLNSFNFNHHQQQQQPPPPPPNYYNYSYPSSSPLSSATLLESPKLTDQLSPSTSVEEDEHQQQYPPSKLINPIRPFTPASIRIPSIRQSSTLLQENFQPSILSAPSRLESKLLSNLHNHHQHPHQTTTTTTTTTTITTLSNQHHHQLNHSKHLKYPHLYNQQPTTNSSSLNPNKLHIEYPHPSLYPEPVLPSHQPQHVFCQGKQFGLSLRDFKIICTLGTGTFGKVLLVRLDRANQRNSPNDLEPHRTETSSSFEPQQKYYAIKVLSKSQVVRLKQVEHVNSEKDLLAQVSRRATSRLSQFFVSLLCTFQDHKNLYMLQEFVEGGELFSHLRRAGRFSADVARFYGANVVLAFQGLHELDIIYRDLKPENLLLSLNGYLKLTDFGFAKKVPDRTWTLCGTPEYLAPEIIQSKGHGKPADWWAFGILLFEMLAGHPPFFNPDPSTSSGPFPIYEKILACELKFPSPAPPPSSSTTTTTTNGFDGCSIDLIKRLLILDRSKRLGNLKGGILDIQNHPWFRGVDWHLLAQQVIPAPILPKVDNPGDPSNFERYPQVSIDDLPGFHPPPNPNPTHHHLHRPPFQHPLHHQPQSYFQTHLAQYSLDHSHHLTNQNSYHPLNRPGSAGLAAEIEDPYKHLFESF